MAVSRLTGSIHADASAAFNKWMTQTINDHQHCVAPPGNIADKSSNGSLR
jgi:hypothetical protein